MIVDWAMMLMFTFMPAVLAGLLQELGGRRVSGSLVELSVKVSWLARLLLHLLDQLGGARRVVGGVGGLGVVLAPRQEEPVHGGVDALVDDLGELGLVDALGHGRPQGRVVERAPPTCSA